MESHKYRAQNQAGRKKGRRKLLSTLCYKRSAWLHIDFNWKRWCWFLQFYTKYWEQQRFFLDFLNEKPLLIIIPLKIIFSNKNNYSTLIIFIQILLLSVTKSVKIIKIHLRNYIFDTIILAIVVFARLCLSVCLCERMALSINLQYVWKAKSPLMAAIVRVSSVYVHVSLCACGHVHTRWREPTPCHTFIRTFHGYKTMSHGALNLFFIFAEYS